jgi:hypothetical protein
MPHAWAGAQTLAQIGRAAEVRQGDAARPSDWWDGQPYRRILLDAPCSASGIVRRHPDVRWLRRRSDIATMRAGSRKCWRPCGGARAGWYIAFRHLFGFPCRM